MRKVAFILLALTTIPALGSCSDPGHDDAVDALGGERPGTPRGPLHRAGQPCLTCHGGRGPGSPQWAVAGTVFQSPGSTLGANGVVVSLTDAKGQNFKVQTNSAGNFYIGASNWQPVYPLHVEISKNGTTQVMKSRIGGTGSCADCHRGNGDSSHVPTVYLGAP